MRGTPLPEEIIIGELEGPQCGPKVHCTPDRESVFQARRRNEKPAAEQISHLQPVQRLADTRTGESFKSEICRPPPARSLASNDIRVGSHFWSSAE